ncbi:hypothetical protein SDC9_62251 [bioreactor metagenome]|uniref:Uncharacterized protein n=1 Tax=bioreactor metagenome TaxID=1076179 RepID=A0A644XIU9_9ZZZZ
MTAEDVTGADGRVAYGDKLLLQLRQLLCDHVQVILVLPPGGGGGHPLVDRLQNLIQLTDGRFRFLQVTGDHFNVALIFVNTGELVPRLQRLHNRLGVF